MTGTHPGGTVRTIEPTTAAVTPTAAVTAAAVATAFEPIARRQQQRIGLGHPTRQGQDLALRQAAALGRPRRRPLPRPYHEFLEADHIGGDEDAIAVNSASSERSRRSWVKSFGATSSSRHDSHSTATR